MSASAEPGRFRGKGATDGTRSVRRAATDRDRGPRPLAGRARPAAAGTSTPWKRRRVREAPNTGVTGSKARTARFRPRRGRPRRLLLVSCPRPGWRLRGGIPPGPRPRLPPSSRLPRRLPAASLSAFRPRGRAADGPERGSRHLASWQERRRRTAARTQDGGAGGRGRRPGEPGAGRERGGCGAGRGRGRGGRGRGGRRRGPVGRAGAGWGGAAGALTARPPQEQLVLVELSGIIDSDFLSKCDGRCKILVGPGRGGSGRGGPRLPVAGRARGGRPSSCAAPGARPPILPSPRRRLARKSGPRWASVPARPQFRVCADRSADS